MPVRGDNSMYAVCNGRVATETYLMMLNLQS